MPHCCTPTTASPKKHVCPVNKKPYSHVQNTTLLHHIDQPWSWSKDEQQYYFCDDPKCEVVYFGLDDSIILQHQLRTPVGIKSQSDNALVCYCFGVTVNEAAMNSQLKEFVIQQTKEKTCACDVRNPSGKCCLKDFPKLKPLHDRFTK